MTTELRFIEIVKKCKSPISERGLETLIQNFNKVRWLVEEANISLEQQLALPPNVQTELYHFVLDFILLITKSHIPFEHLIKLTPAVRSELCANEKPIRSLFNNTPLSLITLLCLAAPVRAELYQKSAEIVKLLPTLNNNYQYFIDCQLLTMPQFFTSLVQTEPFLAIQESINKKLTMNKRLPPGYELTVDETISSPAEKLTALMELVRSVAVVRKHAAIFSSALFAPVPLPEVAMQKIAGYLGLDKQDETPIATCYYETKRPA